MKKLLQKLSHLKSKNKKNKQSTSPHLNGSGYMKRRYGLLSNEHDQISTGK